MDGEIVRLSMSTDPAVRKTVLEVRPAPEHVVNQEALAEWVRSSLGTVARIAGFAPADVTHIRLWKDGRMIEVAVDELRSAAATGEGEEVVRVQSERVRSRELGWSGSGWDG